MDGRCDLSGDTLSSLPVRCDLDASRESREFPYICIYVYINPYPKFIGFAWQLQRVVIAGVNGDINPESMKFTSLHTFSVFAYLLPTRPWTYLVFCNNVWDCIHIMLYGFENRDEIIPRILWTWGDERDVSKWVVCHDSWDVFMWYERTVIELERPNKTLADSLTKKRKPYVENRRTVLKFLQIKRHNRILLSWVMPRFYETTKFRRFNTFNLFSAFLNLKTIVKKNMNLIILLTRL